jgi:ethanolamine ammonia-lyase large subunit
MDTLLTLLGPAGVTFIMGVPGADDVMLNYRSTSFHDAPYLRALLSLKRAPQFKTWLEKWRSPTGKDNWSTQRLIIRCFAHPEETER